MGEVTMSTSVINGQICNAQGVGYRTTLRYTPIDFPAVDGDMVITGQPQTVTTDATGNFTINLEPGRYWCEVGSDKRYMVTVPSGGQTYNFNLLFEAVDATQEGAFSNALNNLQNQIDQINLANETLAVAVDAGFAQAHTDATQLHNDLTTGTVTINTKTAYLEAVLTLDTAAYATGDVFCDKIEFANVGPGTIQSVVLIDTDFQKQPIDLIFFDRDFALTGAKNAAWAVGDTDAFNQLCAVSIDAGRYVSNNLNAIATVPNVGLPIKPNGANLYVGAIIRGVGTYTANGVKIRINIYLD
jgi:hypothetical protein